MRIDELTGIRVLWRAGACALAVAAGGLLVACDNASTGQPGASTPAPTAGETVPASTGERVAQSGGSALDDVLRRQAEHAARMKAEQDAADRSLFSGEAAQGGRPMPGNADAELGAQPGAVVAQDASLFETNPNVRLAFEPVDALDFGTVFNRDKLTGTVRFVNAGTEPLRIESLRTTCGCTAVNAERYKNREYAPGEGDVIEISFTPQTDGMNQKYVVFQTNTAAGRVVRFPVMADVVPVVRTSDQMVRMNDLVVGEPGESSILVESRDADFEVLEVRTMSGREVFAFEVERLDAVESDFPGRARVVLRTAPSLPTGMFNERVEIVTKAMTPEVEGPVEQSLVVTVRGTVPSLVESATRYMRVPTVRPGDAFEATLVLTHVDGEPFEVTGYEVTSPVMDASGLDVEVSEAPESDGERKVLTLRGVVPADMRTARLVGEVMLNFDIPGHGPMLVRFNGAVAGARPMPSQPPSERDGTGVGSGVN